MERDDRPPMATFLSDVVPDAAPATLVLDERAAHHARVKRLEAGDPVRVVDGHGLVAAGAITALRRNELEVALDAVATVPPPATIHLRVPIGDRDRMLWLAEKATELGITTWQSVHFRRSSSASPRGEGPAFAARLRARMVSALEQSGGAWLPRLLPDVAVEELASDSNGTAILLDREGVPLGSLAGLSATRSPVILFGPEGGLEPAERAALVARGWQLARIAESTLRFETAGIAAVAVCRTLLLPERED